VRRRVPLAPAAAIVMTAMAVVSAMQDRFPDLSADLVREPAIAYFTTPATDRVARLNDDLVHGRLELAFDPVQGYLPSVLQALRIPTASQLLVFTKSSVQAPRISPRNPRALYFDDSVTLGYIPGAEFLEFAAEDPRQGVVFYTLDQRAVEKPAIERRDFCLQCHNNRSTLEVPGLLVRSIVTTATGAPVPKFGNYTSDHRSPFEERWAGYYVTGRHGSLAHLGNAMLVDRTSETKVSDRTLNLDSVADLFEVGRYPSPHSDITALLVFEHQMHMINLLTRFGWDARLLLTAHRSDVPADLARSAGEVVDYLLFADETPLPAAIVGSSAFASHFADAGPTDRRGRSLRQLDLQQRLLRYPCSYMIYSDAFDALPPPARDAIYQRIWQVLSGKADAPKYQRLSAEDRRAVIEILRDTKKDLPAYFQ
jgi:hypothetical protein